MKTFLLIAFKIIFFVLLISAVGATTYYLALKQGQPAWIAFAAMAVTATLLLVILTLRRYLQRRRERQFVKRVIDQDQASINAAPVQTDRRLKRLQQRWDKAIALIRASSLNQHGDPVYALPWYMLFGESGSGKSSMAKSSRLTAILSEAGSCGEIVPTSHCDWWFFEKAIILDPTGRYVAPLNSPQDKAEWELFCALLTKYRSKEPLNGIVVTISAERLKTASSDWISQYGLNIRTRIDEMMRCLGAKFPVYIMVTKIDLIFGMEEMAQSVPEILREKPFGKVFSESVEEPDQIVDETISSITQQLKKTSIGLLNPENHQKNVGLLLFPGELGRLMPNLKSFALACFQDNPYQEPPLFYGLFFSSSTQKGTLSCDFLSECESSINQMHELPGTENGYFLHDFFSSVLPESRSVSRDVPDYLGWRIGVRHLGLAAWLMGVFAITLILSISYMRNRDAITLIVDQIQKSPEITGSTEDKITSLYNFRSTILDLNALNHHWYVPRLWLNESIELEDQLQKFYVNITEKNLLNPIYRNFTSKFLNSTSAILNDTQLAHLVEYLVWRTDLLNQRIQKGLNADFSSFPGISGQAMHESNPDFSPYLASYYNQITQSYLSWNHNEKEISGALLEARSWLGGIISRNNTSITWLMDWVNQSPDSQPVMLKDFWGGSGVITDAPVVNPANTIQGKQKIENFLTEIEKALALNDNSNLKLKTEAFWRWYEPEFFQAWYSFMTRFADGQQLLISRNEFMARATAMLTTDNPYFKFMNRLDSEISAFEVSLKPLPWVIKAHAFNLMLKIWHEERIAEKQAKENQGLLGKIEKKITLASVDHIHDRYQAGQELGIAKTRQGTESIDNYLKALRDMLNITQSPDDSLVFVQNAINSKATGSASPLDSANQSISTLSSILSLDPQEPIAKILAGPRDFLIKASMHEAACELQSRWESDILATTNRLPENKLRNTLFGSYSLGASQSESDQHNLIASFINQNAKGIVFNTQAGWQAAKVSDIPFPFTKDFLEFMDDGSIAAQEIQPEYKLTIKSLPTNVTHGATAMPIMTELTLDCVTGSQTLLNFNYPETKEFTWKPEECSGVRLMVEFPDFQLFREYQGSQGFRDFIKEFKGGEKTFVAQDFNAPLTKLGIKDITIRFEFTGADQIMQLIDFRPIKIPEIIANCWHR